MIGENNKLKIYRLVETSGKETFGASILATYNCYIEQNLQMANFIEIGDAFLVYKACIDGVVDIKQGDKAVDTQGNEYIVKKIQAFNNNPEFENYTEIILVKKNG